MTKVNWDLINSSVAIRCKTEKEMLDLIAANVERGGEGGTGICWADYRENTCIKFGNNKTWDYCSAHWYKERAGCGVIDCSKVLESVPNLIAILGLEQGKRYEFSGWKIVIDKDYNLVFDGTDTQIPDKIIIQMINQLEDIHEIKMMTHKELEDLVGCKVIMVN